ncbi:MAG: DUF4426 domain-containing protein [Pseudomonadota bacterium]
MKAALRCALVLLTLSTVLSPAVANAEQKRVFGDFEVHYIVLPTTFLRPDVANRYSITRAQDRALINISVLDGNGEPVAARVTGRGENLLGQLQTLSFREVREPPAIYYLALLRHSDEEHIRFQIDVELPDGMPAQLEFQQKLYWKD